MPLTIGVPRESFPGERRVAMVPRALGPLLKAGAAITIESGAGIEAGIPDAEFTAAGAALADRKGVFASSGVILQVRTLGANPSAGRADLELIESRHTVIGLGEPLTAREEAAAIGARGATAFALELIPRITRAQSMDVLSSMATIAGYRAVILAAETLPKMFPMLMTAAGTVSPAKVFVLGAGVAGLQAIATARRLGAVVSAYDVRAVAREQVESVGAKFVALEIDPGDAETKGGYAKEMGADFLRRQQALLMAVLREQDVVISTAAVPGRKAPVLVTAEMVRVMPPGSVIVDIAAERGGNCELTRAGETVTDSGVRILGPVNLPSALPTHASQMFARNLTSFLKLYIEKGAQDGNFEDEILSETLWIHKGKVVKPDAG
jgi:NAD(P) transhydrogenase subunit alpha